MTSRILLAGLASYLIGAIPTSYLVMKLARGVDLRTVGSGNLGATNLFRSSGWKYAVPVGIFDTLKGAAPVVFLAPWAGLGTLGAVALGILAVVGHVFSVFVGFRGGKGVATGGGIVLGLAPWAFLVALAVWTVVVRFSGYVSLASICAAIVLAPAVWLLHPESRAAVAPIGGLALVVIWFHRANIGRLRSGTEHRFGRRHNAAEQAP